MPREAAALHQAEVLVADEWVPFEANAAHLFFQFVSRRYARRSVLVTSNR
jgi:DNA replication protein DnaC